MELHATDSIYTLGKDSGSVSSGSSPYPPSYEKTPLKGDVFFSLRHGGKPKTRAAAQTMRINGE